MNLGGCATKSGSKRPHPNVSASSPDPTLSHPVAQYSDTGNLHLDHIPRLHWTDARRCSRRDQIARLERHDVGDVADHHSDIEDELARVPVLLHFAVQLRRQFHTRKRIDLIRHHWPHRTESIESLCPRPLRILLLQITRSHIVDDGVPANELTHVRIICQLRAALADHDAKLALIIHALRLRRKLDLVLRRDHRRWWLEEQY